MKYKYEFEEKNFEKGCCDNCPLTYLEYDEDYGFLSVCTLNARYDECPLEEVID